jgi:hypothetical protein
MSKVYILSHGTSNPDYGFERDVVRAFSSKDKAREVLAGMFHHDEAEMTDNYEEELALVINKPDKYFIEGFRHDAFKAFIEEITLE